jgi:hypothetical protein
MSQFDYEGIPRPVRWNDVWPPQAPPLSGHFAARDRALTRLLDYLAEVTWRHTGASKDGEPIEFKIRRCYMFLEQPESEIKMGFPAIAVLQNRNAPLAPTIGPPTVLEETRDRYGKDTVLVQVGELAEDVVLDCWFETRAQRRAVHAGMEGGVLHTNQGPLYLTLPRYFDRVVSFEFQAAQRFDGDSAIRNRRELQITVSMRVESVFLVLMRELDPRMMLEVAPDD